MDDLVVDPWRYALKPSHGVGTGIFVRAKRGDKWESVDISLLDAPSLLTWLRSRGGENHWAEDVVGILLGHGHLHPTEGT